MKEKDQKSSIKAFVVVMVFAELTCAVEASMIYAALAALFRTYGDPVKVGWLITAFLLVSAAAAAVVGRLGDMFGRKRMLVTVLLCALAGSLISAASESLEWIIVGRAIQGVSAAILPLSYGLIRERLPIKYVPLSVGIIAGTAVLGAAIGYLAGGVIVDHLPWRTLFLFSASLAAIGALLCWKFLESSPVTANVGDVDIVGGLLFVPAITAILYAITQVRQLGWAAPQVWLTIVIGVLVLAFWVRYEARHKCPLIDVRLLLNRQILAANLAFACAALGMLQSQMIILPLMQQPTWTVVGLGATAAFAGSLKGAATLLGTVGGPLAGYIGGRFGSRQALLLGATISTGIWIAITLYHSNLWLVAAAGVLTTIGAGVIYGAVANLVVEAAPPQRVSEATGLSSVVRALAGALGSQAIAMVLASSTVSDPAQGSGVFPTQQAYTIALSLVAVMSAGCLIAGLMLPTRSLKPVPQQA